LVWAELFLIYLSNECTTETHTNALLAGKYATILVTAFSAA